MDSTERDKEGAGRTQRAGREGRVSLSKRMEFSAAGHIKNTGGGGV